jgi:Domain of unknown function (DUF1772)
MNNLARILNLLSVVSLSLFSGAFLFIAFVVVRFWQAVEPDIFLSWMSDHFSRFPILMVPLNMVSLLLVIGTFVTSWKSKSPSRIPLGLSLICIFACTLTFPIYFAGANAEFLSREIALPQIENAIHIWATWHWVRTGFAIAALILASFSLFQTTLKQTTETITS